MKRLIGIAFFMTMFSAVWVGVVSAQQPTPAVPTDDDVNRIARQMYCPVCENTPLDVCATQACSQWRGLIREKLAAGWTDEQIKQYFVEQYGARVLAEPPRQGWYMIIYVIPPVLFVLGLYILYRALISMRKPVAEKIDREADSPASGDDEYLNRVEEELKKRN
jgi:cytochrome c-type biogenesis protein CcmH